MRIKQSFCYPLFHPKEMSLDDLFATAADIGYAAVELWRRGDDLDEVCTTAHKHGLVVASMNGHLKLEDGSIDRNNHDRIEDDLKESIDLAVKYEIPGLICLSGNRLDGLSDEDAIASAIDCYKRIAPYAEDKGVNMNLEVLNSKRSHPGYQCDETYWARAVCEGVGSERMKILYDIYHMQIMEGDIIETIRANIHLIGHFHTAGVPGRKDLDDEQELNYPAICRAIAATDFEYYLGHEFSPKGDRMASLRQAFEACDQE